MGFVLFTFWIGGKDYEKSTKRAFEYLDNFTTCVVYLIVDIVLKWDINKNRGTTIIMATHDKDIVNRMKKRVLVIEHGVLTGDYLKGSYKSHESV